MGRRRRTSPVSERICSGLQDRYFRMLTSAASISNIRCGTLSSIHKGGVMPYNRYNTGQGYDPSPQEADWLGGMAYNPYSKGTDFGFALRNTLNNLLAHKQAQGQAQQAQQRYDEEQARADAKVRREEAKAAREAQLAEQKFVLEKRAADVKYRESLNPPKTQHEQTVDALIKGGFAQDAGGAEMLIGTYETAAQKHEAELRKEMAGEAKAAAREAERDKNAENKDLLGRAKDLTIKITGKIRGIEKDPMRGPKDPQIKDLRIMNNFIQRRMNKAIAGNLGDEDKEMLNKVAMAIESDSSDGETPMVGSGKIMVPSTSSVGEIFGGGSDTGVPQEQNPITPPPAQGSNPEEVQLTAREIMTRVAASGKQLSEEEAVALAIQYLKSKQNVR